MRKLFGLIGASAGGWLGWALGAPISMFAAYMASIVLTGVGMYLGFRFAARFS